MSNGRLHAEHLDAFHPIAGVDYREEVNANTRIFRGDGSPYLRVPGCKAVKSVRVDHLVLAPAITHEFPTDTTMTRVRAESRPTYGLGHAADGCPVLMRNTCSNNGIWQKRDIYVEGEWDPKVPAPSLKEPAKA